MTTSNITATVMKGFGTGVGGFSNTATILYAMAAIFDKPGHEDQYKEIMTRIKLLREIVGQEIDRIKGADKPHLPKEWKHFEQINESDTPEEITAKMRRNAMVVSKKPYFFRYLYPELNIKYKQFEASYNQVSRDMFGIKFKKLLVKEDKTEEERNLVRRYQKYSPLITSACTMNKLCKQFEATDFDIKFDKDKVTNKKKPTISKLPTFEEKYSSVFDQQKFDIVKSLYNEYRSQKQIKHLESIFNHDYREKKDNAEFYSFTRKTVYDEMIKSLQVKMQESGITPEEFLFYSNRLSKTLSQFNWGFVWSVLEDKIISLIPQGKTYCPVEDPDGEYEYLGRTYTMKDISKEYEEERLRLKQLAQQQAEENVEVYEEEDYDLLEDEEIDYDAIGNDEEIENELQHTPAPTGTLPKVPPTPLASKSNNYTFDDYLDDYCDKNYTKEKLTLSEDEEYDTIGDETMNIIAQEDEITSEETVTEEQKSATTD